MKKFRAEPGKGIVASRIVCANSSENNRKKYVYELCELAGYPVPEDILKKQDGYRLRYPHDSIKDAKNCVDRFRYASEESNIPIVRSMVRRRWDYDSMDTVCDAYIVVPVFSPDDTVDNQIKLESYSLEQLRDLSESLIDYIYKYSNSKYAGHWAFTNAEKSKKTDTIVINFKNVYNIETNESVDNARDAKDKILEFIQSAGLSNYVKKEYPYSDGDRGRTWYSVSVQFDASIIDHLNLDANI